MSIRKTTAERIEAAKLEKAQMEAEIKRLQKLQNEEERKKRNHRISKRGGLIESLLPDTIGLSDERFYAFLVKTVANDFGRRTLATLKAEQDKEDAANGEDETADTAKSDTVKPAQTPKNNSAATNAKPPEAIKQGA